MNSILGGLCCANTRSKASTRIPLKDTAEGHAASVNAPVDGSTTEEPEKKSPFSMKTDTKSLFSATPKKFLQPTDDSPPRQFGVPDTVLGAGTVHVTALKAQGAAEAAVARRREADDCGTCTRLAALDRSYFDARSSQLADA